METLPKSEVPLIFPWSPLVSSYLGSRAPTVDGTGSFPASWPFLQCHPSSTQNPDSRLRRTPQAGSDSGWHVMGNPTESLMSRLLNQRMVPGAFGVPASWDYECMKCSWLKPWQWCQRMPSSHGLSMVWTWAGARVLATWEPHWVKSSTTVAPYAGDLGSWGHGETF